MAKKKKKSVSTWKKKNVYSIIAPENFDSQEMGTTVASDPALMTGRTVKTSLADLIGDRRKQHLNLTFEVTRVEKDKAYTRFKHFFIPTGYLRYKVRKGNTKVDLVRDMKFGGEDLRMKVMVLSRYRVSDSKKKELVQITEKILKKHTGNKPEKILQLTLFGKLGTEIYKACRKIVPISRVEVYQIKRL